MLLTALQVVGAVAIGYHFACRKARGAPSDPSEAAKTAPYHPLSSYTRKPWYFEEKEHPPGCLKGKIALVTGASSGIGRAVALELYKLGCKVIVTSRSEARSAEACEWIRAQCPSSNGELEAMALELGDLSDVRRFAKTFLAKYSRLHYLIENAGATPPLDKSWKPDQWLTQEGLELYYTSNYLGHFLLTHLLLPVLQSSAPARISVTSSIAHWSANDGDLGLLLPDTPAAMGGKARTSLENASTYSRFRQYGNTKLLQICMCFELQRRLKAAGTKGITVTPLAPGLVSTGINQAQRGKDVQVVPMAISPTDGAKTTIHALLSEDMKDAEGYFLQVRRPLLFVLRS